MSATERDTGEAGEPMNIATVMRSAGQQLSELLGVAPESVSAVHATEEGWTADVEVVEVERIPETSSVLGTYRVQLDNEGRVLGYERTRRYAKGQLDRGR